MADFDYREFGLRKKEYPHTNEYMGSAEQLLAAGLATIDEFPGQPGRAKVVTRFRLDGKPIPSRRGVQRSEASYREIRRAGKKFTVVFQASDDEKKARQAAHDAANRLYNADWEARRLEEARTASHRAWVERTAKEGPHNAAQARDKAFEAAGLHIDLLWDQIFCRTFGAFHLDLTDEDRDVLSEAFEAIKIVVREATLKRRADLSVEIEQCRLAMGARTDAPFQAFLNKTITKRRTAGPAGRAMGAP